MAEQDSETCPTHGEGCVGFVWCAICADRVSVHTHSHPVAEYQEFYRAAREAAYRDLIKVGDTEAAKAMRAEWRSGLDYYDPERQNLISEHDCTFEDGAWWFGHGMPCKSSALHSAEHAITYLRAIWMGLEEPTPNTPAGAVISILRGERTATPIQQKWAAEKDEYAAAVQAALSEAERVYPSMVKGSDTERAMRALITALHSEETQ